MSLVRVTNPADVLTIVEPAHVAPAVAWSRIAHAVDDRTLAAGDGVALVPELAALHGRRAGRPIGVEVPTAAAVGALAAMRHAHHAIDEVDVLEPLYVRPPDITVPQRVPGLPRP